MKHWAPFYRLWLAERKRHQATKVDLSAHRLHYATAKAQRDNALDALKLAQTQRDRARDLVAALLGEERQFSPGDLAWMDEHGVGAE